MEVQLVGYRRGVGLDNGTTFFNCQPTDNGKPFEIETCEELALVLIERMADGRNRYQLEYKGPIKDSIAPGRLISID